MSLLALQPFGPFVGEAQHSQGSRLQVEAAREADEALTGILAHSAP